MKVLSGHGVPKLWKIISVAVVSLSNNEAASTVSRGLLHFAR